MYGLFDQTMENFPAFWPLVTFPSFSPLPPSLPRCLPRQSQRTRLLLPPQLSYGEARLSPASQPANRRVLEFAPASEELKPASPARASRDRATLPNPRYSRLAGIPSNATI